MSAAPDAADGRLPGSSSDLPAGPGSVAPAHCRVLAPYPHDRVTLTAAALAAQVPYRAAQRWLVAYHAGRFDALERATPQDKGQRRIPDELVGFIEGLSLRTPVLEDARLPTAAIRQQAAGVAARRGRPSPRYGTVHEIVTFVDPGPSDGAPERQAPP